jgi:hypothetical protein
MADSLIAWTPRVAAGLALLILGLLAAKALEVALRAILRRLRFDTLVGRAGIDQVLLRLGIRQELSLFVPRFCYFLFLILLAQTLADTFGLAAISAAIRSFFDYLPNIVAALLLLMVGSTVGQFAGRAAAESAAGAGLDIAPSIGRLVSAGVFFICAMMAVAQLKIDTSIVRIVMSISLGAAALGFALSFGFGTREVIRDIAAGFYARKVLAIGRPLEIHGESGTLKAITATHVILDSNGREICIANSAFLRGVSKQQPR